MTACRPEEKRKGFQIGEILLRCLWELVSVVLPALLIALFVNVYVAEAVSRDSRALSPILIENVTRRAWLIY